MSLDAELLREVLNSVLDDRNRIDAETHEAHHQWVTDRIECSRRRREIFDRVVQHVFGWSAVAAVGWLGMKILEAIRN